LYRKAYEEDITKVEDWLQVSSQYVKDNGGSGWLKKYNDSLINALRDIYPGYNWNKKVAVLGSKAQNELYLSLLYY
jgi:hypothetical protein